MLTIDPYLLKAANADRTCSRYFRSVSVAACSIRSAGTRQITSKSVVIGGRSLTGMILMSWISSTW
jgi:hypothetical protein